MGSDGGSEVEQASFVQLKPGHGTQTIVVGASGDDDISLCGDSCTDSEICRSVDGVATCISCGFGGFAKRTDTDDPRCECVDETDVCKAQDACYKDDGGYSKCGCGDRRVCNDAETCSVADNGTGTCLCGPRSCENLATCQTVGGEDEPRCVCMGTHSCIFGEFCIRPTAFVLSGYSDAHFNGNRVGEIPFDQIQTRDFIGSGVKRDHAFEGATVSSVRKLVDDKWNDSEDIADPSGGGDAQPIHTFCQGDACVGALIELKRSQKKKSNSKFNNPKLKRLVLIFKFQ